MHALRIHHFRARYRLPPHGVGERRRLDTILTSALGEAMDAALVGFPLGPSEELCIRHLQVPVRLRLDRTDGVLAAEWGEAVVSAIRSAPCLPGPATAAAAAPPVEVVRYHSRGHALFDISARLVVGDRRRVWAWRQLDLWRAGETVTDAEAVREWVRTLVREPGWVVPVLKWLAETHRLEALARRLEGSHWLSLAAAALEFNGVPLTWKDLTGTAGSDHREHGVGPTSPTWTSGAISQPQTATLLDRIVPRILRDSWIAKALPIHRVGSPGAPGWAALALLESDPGWAIRTPGEWIPLLRRMTEAPGRTLLPVASKDPSIPREVPATLSPPSATPDPPDLRNVEWADRDAHVHDRDDTATWKSAEADEPPEAIAEDIRRRGRTRFGGLLFLLNLLPAVGIPGRLATVFPAFGVREVLYWLGLRLVGELGYDSEEVRDDPAILGFAGWVPGAARPEEAAWEVQDTEGIGSLAREVVRELERLLPPTESESEPESATRLRTVCLREAEVVADPGWIEVRFRLKDVSTDLRRVGLDLDPGYLPWLGVVMRFAYE